MLQYRLGKLHLAISFIFVRVYYLTTVEWREFLPGSSLSHLDYGSRDHDLSLVSGICMVAINISMVLLLCAASSTWTWVDQLLSLVQSLGRDRTTTYQHFKTSSHLGQLWGICYDIAKQYWAAWRLFFWKRSVSPSFLLFCLCFVLLWFLVVLFGFVLEDTWLFALTHSPTRRNSQTKTIRFDDRLSLERARHELKKKSWCRWSYIL